MNAPLIDRTDIDTRAPGRSPWLVLAVIAIAQLMVVLDVTIVNVALPSVQRDLDFTTADRQWVVTAYALAFGGLLLVGGRLSDILGRRTTFLIGLVGFAAASALGGAAQGFVTLTIARAVQGVFGALLAPSALSLLVTTFADPDQRRRALGIYTAIAGAGGAIGLLLGGVLTEYVSWRWCLYVNVAFAVVGLVGAIPLLPRQSRDTAARLDLPGSLLAVTGLIAVVYGLSDASTDGWHAPATIVPIVAGALLLAAFVLVERRVARPLVPLSILTDRTRGAAYLGAVTAGLATIGMFLLITYYLQAVLGFSPLRTGIAFLPFVAGAFLGANVVSNNLGRRGPRVIVPIGLLLAAAGAAWLARLDIHSHYGLGVAPALFLIGIGVSTALITGFTLGPAGAATSDTGVASALVNSSNQIGGSVGAALLNTVATSGTAAYLATHHTTTPDALSAATLHGNTVAFTVLTAVLGAAAVTVGLIHRPNSR